MKIAEAFEKLHLYFKDDLFNLFFTGVFVEQPLASPGSANYTTGLAREEHRILENRGMRGAENN